MAAPSNLRCYQAVRRHLRPHYDSIWIPDSLLASAFERYAATFRTGARYGSSVPGPMENRKRLAKRHMGELHFGQSHSAAPIWELTGLVDLTQWEWTPPTPPDTRSRQNMKITETPSLSDAVLNPIRFFFPPQTDDTDALHKLDQMLLPRDMTLSGVAEPLTSDSWDAQSTPSDVIAAALDSLSGHRSNESVVPTRFSKFCDGWQQALAKDLFYGDAIAKVLTGIIEGLSAEFINNHGSKTANDLKLLLLDATIEGISKGGSGKTALFDRVAWGSILHEMSKVQKNTLRLFSKALSCIPTSSLEFASPGIVENIITFCHGLGRAAVPSSMDRQTAKMAACLKSLREPELRFVLDDATKKILDSTSDGGVNYLNARFSWLLLLARLPGVDQEYLARACIALENDPAAQPLSAHEICHLFLVWANNQAPVNRYVDLRGRLKKCIYTKPYSVLGVLLWQSGQFHRARHLAVFLHAIGREFEIFLLAKGACHACRREPARLAIIALGMRKPLAAVDILCLYEESQKRESPFWESKFGFRALEILTWVPRFDHTRFYNALRIQPGQHCGPRHLRGKAKGIDEYRIRKIAAVGIVTGLSPHITTRKSVDLMMSCYLSLQRHGTKLPHAFLRALVHSVTRQLVDGQPGILSRLRYVLFIIERHMGRDEAERLARAMQGLRRSNFRLG
ncbi:hypothetical protein F5Y03DRAFT_381757 [Xylaria venustula]|nr:hypothetical protein F5Y03DRAFT_381757 [Xylaria venustula]